MNTPQLHDSLNETDETTRMDLLRKTCRDWAEDKLQNEGTFHPVFIAITGNIIIPILSEQIGLEDDGESFVSAARDIGSANHADCAILITHRALKASVPLLTSDNKFQCAMVYIHSQQEKNVTFFPLEYDSNGRFGGLLDPSAIPHDTPDMIRLLVFPECAEQHSRFIRGSLRKHGLGHWIMVP